MLAHHRNAVARLAAAAVRGLAGKARGSRKAPAATEEVHDLRATMRKLAFLVHPDRFPNAPDAARENAESLATLQGLLTTVQKSRDSHPPAGVRSLRFHMHTSDGQTRAVTQVLRTTGGDCRRVVERSLSELFAQCGLPRAFRWADGDWVPLSEDARAERDNRGDPAPQPQPPPAEPPVAAAYAADNVARPPRAADGSPVDLASALKSLDPLLNAVAAVPWLPLDEAGAARRHYIIHHVIRELASAGWAIERGCVKIWNGRRDADALEAEELAAGTDAASAQALKMVVFHARALEAELGPPTV